MTVETGRAPTSEPGLEPRAEFARAFKSVMGAVRRLRGREAQRLGTLSYAQYSLLFGLAAESELSARRLAGLADLSPATVTQMLDHLESDGLVERVRSAKDKRVVLVSLTAPGRALVEEHRARYEPRWQAALADFSDAELLSAATILERLREMFDTPEDPPERSRQELRWRS